MRRWLALSLLGLLLGCREKSTEWGQTCRTYIDLVTDDCTKHGKKTELWKQVCPGYLEAIQIMQSSIPAEGTFKTKFDQVEPLCSQNLETFKNTTKDPTDFPRK